MLTEKDILLIQNKVDGTLSRHQEELFASLVESSSQANDLYAKLLALHREMNERADLIPEVDITQEVMRRIADKSFFHRMFSGSVKIYAFAASLVLVFILGALAVTFLIPSVRNLPEDQLSGTMAPKEPSLWTYHDKGIDIEVQQYRRVGLQVYWVSVFSANNLNIVFSSQGEPVADGMMKIIDSDDLVREVEDPDRGLSYICRGNVIFALAGPPDLSCLTFFLNGKQVFRMVFPPTF